MLLNKQVLLSLLMAGTIFGARLVDTDTTGPILLAPGNREIGQSLTPTLAWDEPVNLVTQYTVQVSMSPGFGITVYDQTGPTCCHIAVTPPLLNNTTYYWRVDATDASGTSPWSDVWSFTTACATLLITAEPVNTSVTVPNTATFTCAATGSVLLAYQWYYKITPSSINVAVGTNSNSYTTPATTASMDGYTYWCNVTDPCGLVTVTTLATLSINPTSILYQLKQQPEMFSVSNLAGTVRYTLPQQCHVSLKYFDIEGRLAGSYIDKEQSEGIYTMSTPMLQGMYIQVFQAGKFMNKQEIALVR